MTTPDYPVAVISGATGGIGCVLARHLYSAGYHVLGLGKTQTAVDQLARHAETWPSPHLPAPRRVFKVLDVEGPMCEAALHHHLVMHCEGRLDTLLCAHGAPPCPGAFDAMPCTDWETVLHVDLLGTMRLCHAALPFLLRRNAGVITLLSSFHVLGTYPERVPYSTAKTALVGLARALAVEYGTRGIRANVIAPGQVDGPRTDGFIAAAWHRGLDLEEAMKARSPMRRLVQPDDIARTALWLLETPAVTGQTIVLDHGWSASLWHQPYVPAAWHQPPTAKDAAHVPDDDPSAA